MDFLKLLMGLWSIKDTDEMITNYEFFDQLTTV